MKCYWCFGFFQNVCRLLYLFRLCRFLKNPFRWSRLAKRVQDFKWILIISDRRVDVQAVLNYFSFVFTCFKNVVVSVRLFFSSKKLVFEIV